MKNAGRSVFQRIYHIVAQVPPGRVVTYGQIAAWLDLPRGARTVGWAMWEAPAGMNLPCHRVVSKNGDLAPAHVFGGRQRALLEAEGVLFTDDGRVVMERHLLRGLPEIF